MATEANIQEALCLKKGEREENSLTSESFEEKVTELPGNQVKQLETSSLVTTTVYTPLETSKPTDESGIFFQALSVTMVIADEPSNTPESCKAAKQSEPECKTIEIEEKTIESEVCGENVPEKSEPEVGLKLLDSVEQSKKEAFNVSEKNQGDSDGVASSQDAACEDIKVTPEEHAAIVADFKEQDLNEMPIEFAKEETDDKSVDAQQAAEQCEIGSKDTEEQKHEKIEQDEETEEIKPDIETEKREQDGLVQAITPDACISTQTSQVQTTEHEEKEQVVNVLEKDQDEDDVTRAQEVTFEGGLQEKDHHSEDNEHEVVKLKGGIEEDADVCVSTQTTDTQTTLVKESIKTEELDDEKAIEKEVGEENGPKKTELEEGLEISDSMAPSQKEILTTKDKDQGDNDGVTGLQESPCVDVEETTTVQHVTTAIDFKEQDLNEKPREFINKETEDKSLDAQEASGECKKGAKEEIDQNPEESVIKIEKEEETAEIKPGVEIEKTEHEEEDTQNNDGLKEKSDSPSIEEVSEETGPEKDEYEKEVKDSAIATATKDETEDEEKEQEANVLETDEGKVDVTSAQDVTFEKDLQEKNHHNEDDEREAVTAEESIEKDTEVIKSSEKMEQQTLINDLPSDVCISTQTEPIEETTENIAEESVERDHGQTNKSEEGLLLSDSSSKALNENETVRKDQEKEQEIYITEKVQSGGDEVTSSGNASNEQEQHTEEIKPSVETTEEKDVCIPTQIESQENATKNEDNTTENDGDRKEKSENPFVNEVCEVSDLKKTEPEEEIKLTDSSNVTTRESVDEATEETKSSDETKETMEQQEVSNDITADISSSTQTENIEKTTAIDENKDEETIEHDDGQTEKPESPLVEVKQSDSFSTTLNEDETLSKEENLEKEGENKTSEVQGGEDDVTSSKNASNEDIKETKTGHHDTNVAYVEEGQGVIAVPKEILTEQADDKSIHAEELGHSDEQNVEETQPCLSETISQNPEDEIKKEDKDLSDESVEDANDDSTKEEKCTLEQEHVEEHNDQDEVSKEKVTDLKETKEIEPKQEIIPSTSLETSTEDTSNSEKEKAESEILTKENLETVSEEKILEFVPKSEEPVLKETETHVDEEKGTVTKEISSAEKTEVQSDGDDVTSSQNASNGDIQETIGQHDTTVTFVEQGQGMSATPKEILIEEAEDKSVVAEEMPLELGQPNEQNVEEAHSCLGKITTENPEEEIKKEDKDLSHESVEDTNDDIVKEEKCTLKQEPVEEHSGQVEVSKEQVTDLSGTTEVEPQEEITPSTSLETSTEDTSISQKIKAESENLQIEDLETVSEVEIPELVPKSEEPTLKEKCFILETEPRLDEEKETVTEEISSDEKTQQTTEIKQETVKEVCEETSSEKAEFENVKLSDSSNMKINEKEIVFKDDDEEKDQDVNMSTESQGEDILTSSQIEVSEEKEDLKEKNNQGNEGDFNKSGQGVEEDTEDIKSSVDTKENTEHVTATDVCSSTQTETREETIENEEKNGEKAIEQEYEAVSREEDLERKQEDVEETKMGEHATTNEEKVVCVSTQSESQEEPTKNAENAIERDGDQKEKSENTVVKEVCEEKDLTTTEAEGRQLSDSSEIKTREGVDEDTEETKSSDEPKEKMEQQEEFNAITSDVCSSTQTEIIEKSTASEEKNDVETIENNDGQTEKPASPLVEVVCETTKSEIVESQEEVKQSDHSSTTLNENETLSKEEKLEKEDEIKTSEVEGGEVDVTSSHNSSNEDIKEITSDQQNTTAAPVEEGQGVNALPKEILIEEAEDKSIDAEEKLMEHGQPNEQNVEETHPCVSKIISEIPEDEIKKEDRDLSLEGAEDRNDNTAKEEKFTLEHEPIEEHIAQDEVSKEKVIELNVKTEVVEPQEDAPSVSSETLTEVTSNSEKEKEETENLPKEDLKTVSEVQIPEAVARSEESVLKEECFISEKDTRDEEKGTITEEISSAKKTEQTAEIKQETVMGECEETSSEKTEREEGLNEKEIITLKEDDQEVNTSAESQGEDNIASSQNEVSEEKEDLKEKNHHNEGDFIECGEGVDEDTREFKSSVETKDTEHVVTTNSSAQIEPDEETIEKDEKNDENEIVGREENVEKKQEDIKETNMGEHATTVAYFEEEQSLSEVIGEAKGDKSVFVQEKTEQHDEENVEKEQKAEEQNDEIKPSVETTAEKDVCISTQTESHVEPTKNEENVVEGDGDKKENPDNPLVKEVCEEDDLTKTESEERQLSESSAVKSREYVNEDTEETKSRDEIKENVEQQGVLNVITTDVSSSTQTQNVEKTTASEENNDEETIEHEEKPESTLVEVVCEETRSEIVESEEVVKQSETCSTALNENEAQSKEEKLEKEDDIKTSEVEGGEVEVTNSQNASNEDIIETMIDLHNTNVAHVDEGQAVSVLPKEILKEEAKDKSADAEETSLELGQPNEQNAEETLPCLTKSIGDNPEDEIKKEDRDLSNESVKDTNDGSIKEEKCTIEQGPVEEHNDSDEVSKEKVTNLHETTEVEPQEDITPSISLETLTEDTSNPEEKKAEVETLATEDLETVSDVQIPELVPKSEESVLKKECFISEIETHLDGEKESVTEKISNDEKTAQTAEIKQETVKEVCEEITREEAEDKSIHDQEASEQCENEAKDKIEQQPEESVNKPVNSSYSETNEGSIKEEQEDTDNNTKIESELEAENQADKIEDRTEMKDEVVLTEKVSKELEQNKKQNVEETETKDEDLSHDSIELINENITTEEKCLPDVITRELEISTLEHESINNSQDEVSKEKITDLNEPTAVEPHEDITLSSSLETSTEDTLSSNKAKAVSENLPLEDLESVSKVHIPEVVAKSEDLKMKEECLVSTTETYADEENRIATKEISSDENLETHGSAQQPENSYSITEESVTQLEQTGETNSLYENRDIKEEVTQENQLNSTEDCNEMEKDVNLTKEVPSETEKGKGINDLKEKIVEEDTYSPELEEKSTQSQKEIGHEISNLDLMPAEKPMVTEVNVDAQIGQEDLQGKEDISCVSEVTNDATVESVDLSTIESTAYPSEIEKLATRSLESDRDVQIPEVVADSKDSKVKEECIVIATTAENSVEEQDTKTKEISSAPDKEQENVTKATTESDEAKSSDLIIEEKALTKENLEIHGELEPTSEPAIEDQVIIETKPQPEQSDITSENIINDQTSESKLEHTSRKDSEDVKGHTEEHVTLASENETKSIENLNETTKDIILTDEVVVETEKEKEKDETEGQVPEDVKCLTEIDGTSTLDQKELASEMEYSKPIPVGNIDLTEVKEESQREENIQATEDLSCLSKASSVIEASKMDMHEDTKQTITVIEGVNDDSIDEAKDKIVPVLEDSKASELQVNLPEIESTDTPTNSQESMKLREEVSCRTQETIEEKDALTSQLTDREILEEKDDKPISELRTFSEDQISINERCIEEEVQSNFDVEIKDAIIGNEAVEDVITNEVLLEDEKAKESKSNKDIINEEAKLTQLTSDTDVGQIEKADSKSDELLETKQLVEDTEDVKFTVENLSIKDETITVIKKSNEDSEVVASEFKRLEDTVTDKEKETLDEPQADDSEKTTSTEQHIEVRSEESRGQSDMLKLKENPTVVTEVAKIVPECRDASAILADTLPEPSPEVLLAKPEDKITENQEVLPSVEKDFIDVQKHEKDLDHETEVRIADVVSNVECSEIEPRYLKTKETTLEFINQENQREQKKEANASIKDVIPVEDVKISTREPEVGSADLEVPSITDTTADKANNKTLEVQEAGGLLKDDKQLESACDQSKSKEEGSGVKQEPSELDASGTLGTAATEELKISQKYVPDDLIIISQTHAEIPKHKVPACTVDKQSPNEPQPKESTESKIFTENIDSPGEPVAKSLTPEAADLEANTPVFVDQKEKSLSVEPAKIVSHEPATENSEVAGSLIGEKDSALTKDQQVEKEETVKTDDEDEGEDNEEDETMGSCSDAPVMVEASKDMEVKAHKKSHNILSGVGSKVKHSIAKVKKAITGKSSSPTKSTSPKAKNQVTD